MVNFIIFSIIIIIVCCGFYFIDAVLTNLQVYFEQQLVVGDFWLYYQQVALIIIGYW